MIYRREIDGLRAVAVVPVILFHAGFAPFAGGYVGVDVFFVISGYLITTIIADALAEGRFSLLGFYEARCRRILPALFCVMLACIPFALVWMQPHQLHEFMMSMLAVSVFASNFFFWRQSSYFAAPAEEMPLLHTWSLAVEEQFYVLFPLLLLLVWRLGRRRILWLFIALGALSLLLAEWGWREASWRLSLEAQFYLLLPLSLLLLWCFGRKPLLWMLVVAVALSLLIAELGWRARPEANFFLAPARAWELLAGAAASFLIHHKGGVQHSNALSLAGLGAIALAVFSYDRLTPFPSLYALLPVAGTFLVVVWGGEQTITARLLSGKALVGAGLISYSAYLWHQPLFAFARIRLLNEPSPAVMLALCVLAFVLAALSWRFVEQPFRRKGTLLRSRSHLLGASLAGAVLFAHFGLALHTLGGYPFLPDLKTEEYLERSRLSNPPYTQSCTLGPGSNDMIDKHPLAACTDFFIAGDARVMFLGDSHAQAIGYEAQKLLFRNGIGSYGVNYKGCIGVAGFYRIGRPTNRCDAYVKEMLAFARKLGVDTIVLTARFPAYYHGPRYDNGEGGVEDDEPIPVNVISSQGRDESIDSPTRKEAVLAELGRRLEELATQFRVVLVYPIPAVGWHIPNRLAKLKRYEPDASWHITTSYPNYRQRTKEVTALFDGLESGNVLRVRPDEVLCDIDLPGRCNATTPAGEPLYSDDDHLNEDGAKLLAPLILEALQGQAGQQG